MPRHFIPSWRFLASKAAVASLATCLLVVALAYAGVGSRSVSTNLNVTVGEQIVLVQRGGNLLFEVRLARGVTAQLWADNSCGSPKNNAMVFTKSGSYTIPIQSIAGHGERWACALSSDGKLQASTPIIKAIPTISVACTPSTLGVNSQTMCAATVTGFRNPGTPTGSVTLSSNGSGSFAAPNPCTLTSGAGNTASCSVKYTPSAAGTQIITATYSGDGNYSPVSASANLPVYASASKLAFSGQPSNTQAGSSITPAVQVQVQDANGTVVANSAASITMAIGTNPGGGTLGGTKTVSAVNGVATFSNLSINKTGNGYTLTASSSPLAGAISSAFNIAAGPAATLLVAGYPSPTTAGTAHNFTVTAKDALGNTAIGYTGTVRFTGSDSQAILPANYTFVASDNGTHTFSATLKTKGTQSITATDTARSSITGTQSGITVN